MIIFAGPVLLGSGTMSIFMTMSPPICVFETVLSNQ